MSEGSRIFVGHRALGYVANHVPLVTRYIHSRREHLVVTSVGRVFHTYGCAKLSLLSVSKIHPEEITAITADAYLVFSAAGKEIFAWRRGTELKHVYSGHESEVHTMMPFGPHLISVDAKSVLKVWDIKTEKLEVEFEFNNDNFEITCVAHPATYLNKILLGSRQGRLQLWNLKTREKLYKFKGWGSAVLCIEQAPAIDVVAIGLESGDILVHNLKYDETIVKFSQDWGAVTGLTFRTDGPPILISSSGSGHLALWDLEERRMAAQTRDAHSAEVAGIQCLQGEPLLLTSSPDNTLKQWIFDLPDGGSRLLRLKEGHAAPPTKIRFYGGLGNNILSSGEDSSLRSFSTVTDLLNKSFGVASWNRKLSKKHKKLANPAKMEPIIDFTTETTRDRDWDNIACVHRDTTAATTWSFGNQKMGDLKLRHERFKTDETLRDARASCLCLTVCGNFVLIGYTSGHVDKYNIQSGIHRGSLVVRKDLDMAHPKREVRGICTDGLNQIAVTGDNQGLVQFWHFSSHRFLSRHKFPSAVVQMEMHRDSSLVAVALSDFSLQVLDAVSRNVVRVFVGHDHPITDMCFSADSRWLVTASLDGTAKVWDVPAGHLVDYIRFPAPATSITMSPKGEFLATAHSSDLGLYLWTNRTLYSHVTLKPWKEGDPPKVIQMPITSRVARNDDDTEGAIEREGELKVEEMDDEETFASPEQIADSLITLANLPESRWKNLLSLDVIKERNKPRDAVQKPKNAPFFIPTISGLETKFDLTAGKTESSEGPEATRTPVAPLVTLSAFGKALLAAETEDDLSAVLGLLKEAGPSAIEVEVVGLAPEGGGTPELMSQFLSLILSCLRRKRDFEACQAYLGLFMKKHADAVMESAELTEVLEQVLREQETCLREIARTLEGSATLVGFFKNSVSY